MISTCWGAAQKGCEQCFFREDEFTTDGMIEESQRKRYTEKQREAQRYAEALHGTLSVSS